jgi:cell division protein FtsZ
MPDPGADRQAILAGVEHGTEPCLALIGCGGTGCNVLAEGVLEIKGPKLAMGSEPKVLDGLEVDHRIRVQPRRLESEAKSVMSSTRLAGTETEAGLVKVLKGSDLAFIIAGLGGDTGGWAAAMAARACKVARCLSLCVVSEPFKVEGQTRAERAREQGRLIMEYADGLLVLPNDMILGEAP